MFAGHYSSAFVAKAAAPRAPLWSLLLAAQFVDILWSLCVFAGIEHVRLEPGLASNPLDLYDMPYTHSLLATAIWSGVGFVAARQLLRLSNRDAGIVAGALASWLGFAAALVLLQTSASFGPIPGSVVGMVSTGLALYLVTPAVGAGVERFAAREPA